MSGADDWAVRTHRLFPLVFFILALVSGLFVSWNLPPFMAPDEPAHLQRADLATFGRLTAEKVGPGAGFTGGPGDLAIDEAARPFDDVRFQPQNRADWPDYVTAFQARFDGRTGTVAMLGAGASPPVFYLPATVAIVVAKAMDWPVVQGLYLARGLNTLFCAAVGALALSLAGRARAPLFTVLLLPMTTFLYGAVSIDGPMIAVTALAVGLIARAMQRGDAPSRLEWAGAVACLTLVGMTKIPYALFGLAFLFIPAASRRARWIAVAVSIGLPLLWAAWAQAMVQTPLERPGVVLDPGSQAAFLATHLPLIPQIALETLRATGAPLRAGFIGVLGWLDTPLPARFYGLAYAMLALSLIVGFAATRPVEWRRLLIALPVLLLLSFGAIFAALYMTWTPVGDPVVVGVQGRYFLPLAVMACLLVEGRDGWLDRFRLGGWIEAAANTALLTFPLASLLVVQRVMILRYYLD